MIIPARWYAGGRGLDEFRKQMLEDNSISILHDFPVAAECFNGVEIKGGVCYFLWEKNYSGLCTVHTHLENKIQSIAKRPLLEDGNEVFIRYNEAISILNKVKSFNEISFSTIVSSQKPFGLRTFFEGKKEKFPNSVKVYANNHVGYIGNEAIEVNKSLIETHKIIIPRAVGSGDSRSDLFKPIYSEPGSCCTETYVLIGPFVSEFISYNVIKYIKTKFFHFLVTLIKNTMMAPKTVYQFVPMQDFTEEWTDEKLYKKYGLTEEEIAYIESIIRPMDATLFDDTPQEIVTEDEE